MEKVVKKLKSKPEVTRWGKKKSTKSTKFLWSAFFSSIVSSVDTGAVPWHSAGCGFASLRSPPCGARMADKKNGYRLWSVFFFSIVSSVDTGAEPWHSTG